MTVVKLSHRSQLFLLVLFNNRLLSAISRRYCLLDFERFILVKGKCEQSSEVEDQVKLKALLFPVLDTRGIKFVALQNVRKP